MHVYLLLQVHECQFEYLTEGVYPAVNLHYEGDEVKLRNYYFGPESVMMDQSQPNTQKVCSASVTCNKARPGFHQSSLVPSFIPFFIPTLFSSSQHSIVYPFISSLLHSFLPRTLHSFLSSLVPLFVCSSFDSFLHPFLHPFFICPFLCLFIL